MIVSPKAPWIVGGTMGLMLPWMMHGEGWAGVWIILAHLAVFLAVAAITLVWPDLRRRFAVRVHRPRPQHLLPMGFGVLMGWAVTCAYCSAVGGQHWT